jgi:signal transduction histidine kinase
MFLELFGTELAEMLAASAQLIEAKDGLVLFHEGDPADSIYLVLQGSVRLTKKDSTGKEQFLTIAKENDFFGEFGVLDGLPRSAGAITAGHETVLARIPSEAVKKVCNQAGSEGPLKLALHIIRKLRESNERYVEERVRKERMTLLGEMAGTIIHDLRNPFAVIQMATYMIRQKATDPVTMENCDFVEAQIMRLQTMVEEILEFSRGKAPLRKVPINLNTVLASLSRLNNAYLAQGIKLTIIPLSKVIEADETKLTRVLQNLVCNAVEAFAGKQGTITVEAKDLGDFALITVADNGPGIPDEFRARMFEPFSTTGKAKGTGLGMAIAKSIIEAHGGQLACESTVGQGTTFSIQIPVKGPPPPFA